MCGWLSPTKPIRPSLPNTQSSFWDLPCSPKCTKCSYQGNQVPPPAGNRWNAKQLMKVPRPVAMSVLQSPGQTAQSNAGGGAWRRVGQSETKKNVGFGEIYTYICIYIYIDMWCFTIFIRVTHNHPKVVIHFVHGGFRTQLILGGGTTLAGLVFSCLEWFQKKTCCRAIAIDKMMILPRIDLIF